MEITTIDVGQGHCAVLRHQNESIIIDTRIPPSGSECDFVKQRLAETVKQTEVIGLVLTGFDADHADVEGVALVLRKYQPRWVMYPKYRKDSTEAGRVFRVIRDAVESRGGNAPLRRIPVRLEREDSQIFDGMGLAKHFSFEAFSPHEDELSSSNNSSLVMRVCTNNLSYLITGDTENDRWVSILRSFASRLKSDVLQAPHHGSKNGISLETIRSVRPHTVLISAGRENQFGHPHPEALSVYRRGGAQVFVTTSGTLRTWKSKGIFWDSITTQVVQ